MTNQDPDDRQKSTKDLLRRIDKLEKINAALMNRVERSLDQQANAYSMFQTAIGLESQIRIRTEELKSALTNLEIVNEELTSAHDASERANSVKTRFFTAVSHDVLQPLHAAQLSLSALIEGTATDNQRRLAMQVDHALASIGELLRTMLDISKLEAGVVRPKIEPIALRPLFESLVVDMRPLVDAKRLRITSRCGHLAVLSDTLMLRRILQNLLANAHHYTREGGILLAARRRGDVVRMDVWDTGPGIPEAERQRIFEEFQRGSTSLDTHRGGFGLGLSIVTRMAQTLEHPIDMCSTLGRGTRFSIFAPATEAASTLPQSTTPTQATGQTIGLARTRVLIIDNDPSVLEAMFNLLSRWECEARTAHDLNDIDRFVANNDFRPEILLADFHLDRGTRGTQAIERVREAFDPDLPAIIITADRSDEIVAAASELNCEVLHKPIRPAELRALMQHMLN
jgi:signal transduction histidine kinase